MHLTRCVSLVGILLPALAAADPVVLACLKSETSVRGGVLLSAKQAASEIFDGIGVELRWSCTSEPAAIVIRLAPRPPKGFRKGTLAYALPFARQGVRITVFYDRLESILEDHWLFAGSIFGHVLAHEIGHVLERVDSHAQTGLMRGYWTERDFQSIKFNSFGFTPEDARSIRNHAEQEDPIE